MNIDDSTLSSDTDTDRQMASTVARVEQNRRSEEGVEKRESTLVCDVHGVACFKPEKKAKWKHVNTRSSSFRKELVFLPRVFFFKWQVASHESASGWELKAARVTT